MPKPTLAELRIPAICESIDRLMNIRTSWETGQAIETRPGETHGTTLRLYDAARAQTGRPLVLGAAEALLEAVKHSGAVIVSAGWVIDFWYPRGELCGVVGAVALARAIAHGLQVPVLFVTEEPVMSVFEAGSRALGMWVYPYDVLGKLPYAVAAKAFPVDPTEARREAQRLLDELRPAAIIAIEKCSPNKKGVHHTGLGHDMSATTAKVDVLVRQAQERGVLTIGIGDLGNEIGFGRIRPVVEEHLPWARECACPCKGGVAADIATDHLIVASSSNRGAYGLAAALATIRGDVSIMPTGADDTRIINAAAFAGASDSFLVNPAPTDGHGMFAEDHAHFIELMRYQVRSRDVTYPLFRARA